MTAAPFDTVEIRGMQLKNRFVRSATYDGCAERGTGHVSEAQLAIFSALAEGGVGLIVTGVAHVIESGQATPFQLSITDDACISGLRSLVEAVHQRGAKIAIQLFHAGREAAPYQAYSGREAVAPSAIDDDPYFWLAGGYRALTEEEIEAIVKAFGDGARRARDAGFDAVQVHGAHAYLFSQFLSPYTNRRGDRWGGTLDNRLRLHRSVYEAVRSAVGPDYPVLIKLGVADCFENGLALDEGLAAAEALAAAGFDALEISSGLRGEGHDNAEFRTKVNRPEREAYFREWSRQTRRRVRVPVIAVGGFRGYERASEVVAQGEADLVALSRPLIREPGLINDWREGDTHIARCISCNLCLMECFRLTGEPLRCLADKGTG